MNNSLKSILSIAPMIDWSYSHFRVLMRILAPSALIYTEMQTTGAIAFNPQRALSFNFCEQPLALQLGGSDKEALKTCVKKAELQGFTEVNLNLGCPSDKVQAGRFGACLMADALLVKDCIKAMKESVDITVSAKTRIGIDEQDSYAFFRDFIQHLVEAGCDKIIVHARKAWLKGLNPKQNRTIPPINYDFVYRIKQEHPDLPIVINGNITNSLEILEHLNYVDGVMVGRLACQNPFAIAAIHDAIYQTEQRYKRSDLLANYFHHALQAFEQGEKISLLLKPIYNYAHGLPGANRWKKLLMRMQAEKNLHLVGESLELFCGMETQTI